MALITVKIIVFKNGKVFLNFAPIYLFFAMLTSRTGDKSYIFSNKVKVKLFCFDFHLVQV